jgi:hypothetical protein
MNILTALNEEENKFLKIVLRADLELLQEAIKKNDWAVVKHAERLLSMGIEDRLGGEIMTPQSRVNP